MTQPIIVPGIYKGIPYKVIATDQGAQYQIQNRAISWFYPTPAQAVTAAKQEIDKLLKQ